MLNAEEIHIIKCFIIKCLKKKIHLRPSVRFYEIDDIKTKLNTRILIQINWHLMGIIFNGYENIQNLSYLAITFAFSLS